MQKPLISASAEMGGFVLVESPAPSLGEQNVLATVPFRSAARLRYGNGESIEANGILHHALEQAFIKSVS